MLSFRSHKSSLLHSKIFAKKGAWVQVGRKRTKDEASMCEPNFILMDGGKAYVPPKLYGRFMQIYADEVDNLHTSWYFQERNGQEDKDVMRLWFELDIQVDHEDKYQHEFADLQQCIYHPKGFLYQFCLHLAHVISSVYDGLIAATPNLEMIVQCVERRSDPKPGKEGKHFFGAHIHCSHLFVRLCDIDIIYTYLYNHLLANMDLADYGITSQSWNDIVDRAAMRPRKTLRLIGSYKSEKQDKHFVRINRRYMPFAMLVFSYNEDGQSQAVGKRLNVLEMKRVMKSGYPCSLEDKKLSDDHLIFKLNSKTHSDMILDGTNLLEPVQEPFQYVLRESPGLNPNVPYILNQDKQLSKRPPPVLKASRSAKYPMVTIVQMGYHSHDSVYFEKLIPNALSQLIDNNDGPVSHQQQQQQQQLSSSPSPPPAMNDDTSRSSFIFSDDMFQHLKSEVASSYDGSGCFTNPLSQIYPWKDIVIGSVNVFCSASVNCTKKGKQNVRIDSQLIPLFGNNASRRKYNLMMQILPMLTCKEEEEKQQQGKRSRRKAVATQDDELHMENANDNASVDCNPYRYCKIAKRYHDNANIYFEVYFPLDIPAIDGQHAPEKNLVMNQFAKLYNRLCLDATNNDMSATWFWYGRQKCQHADCVSNPKSIPLSRKATALVWKIFAEVELPKAGYMLDALQNKWVRSTAANSNSDLHDKLDAATYISRQAKEEERAKIMSLLKVF